MSRRFEGALVHLMLVVASLASLYPALWVVALALSPAGVGEARGGAAARLVPIASGVSLEHFRALFSSPFFARQLATSLVVAATTALVAVALATPAAYALARFPSSLTKPALRALLMTQMFPAIGTAVPLYAIVAALGLLDTRSGLVLVYAATAVPFAVFQLRSAFEAIPEALEEAALVDGATRFQAFVRVVLPAARPALSVTALFAFMSAWNEFILAATFLSKEESYTLPVVLQRVVGEHGAAWGLFAAGSVVVSVPVMAIFYVLQRHIVSGLTAGGVKG